MPAPKPQPFEVRDATVTHVIIELFGGDNNLSRFVVEDLQEMAAGNRGPFATLALTDVAGGGAEVVELSSRTGHHVVQTLGEIDTGDPVVLADFIARALVTYPGAHIALGFWDHGTGVFDEHDPNELILDRALRGVSRATRSRSVPARRLFIARDRLAAQPRLRAMLHDDTSGGVLTNVEAHGVVKAAFLRAGVKKIDIIFSDTCLNGMIEVLEQFRPFAEVVVGSEDLEPGDGWEYQLLFSRMSDSPPPTAAAWAGQMVGAFEDAYLNRPNQHPCTLAAFRTENTITDAFRDLVTALKALRRPGFAAVQAARAFAQSFAQRDTFDIKDFVANLLTTTNDPAVQRACGKLQAAVGAACVANCAVGTVVENAHGLAFWLPGDRRAFNLVNETYQKLEFDKSAGWAGYLASIYNP